MAEKDRAQELAKLQKKFQNKTKIASMTNSVQGTDDSRHDRVEDAQD